MLPKTTIVIGDSRRKNEPISVDANVFLRYFTCFTFSLPVTEPEAISGMMKDLSYERQS